jgi:hypothetical protein
MKKHLSLLLVPIYLVSCVSNPVAQSPRETPTVNLITNNDNIEFEFLRLSDCAEKNANRAPSAETKCLSFYEKDLSLKDQPATAASYTKTRVLEQFGQTENFGLWTLVLGTERVRSLVSKPRSSRLHPVELLTDKEVKSISLAWRTLRDIPDTKFSLSTELVLDVNKLLMGDVETKVIQDLNSRVLIEAEKKTAVEKIKSSIASYFNAAPGLRKKASREEIEEVSDDVFNIYKTNIEAVGGKVIESADSVPNKRVFVVEAPRSGQLVTELRNILDDANRKVPEVSLASYNDKVNFVADLHMKLAALDPLTKMNDATIQMVVNRVLIQIGIDPAVKMDIDLSMTRDQVAEVYRNALADYIRFTEKSFEVELDKDGNPIARNEAVSITGRGAGLRVKITGKYAKKYPRATALMRDINRVTPFDNRSVQLGRDRRVFVLKDDGFLYDGITPHTIRNEDGKLKVYPISDAAYRLIGLNGDFTGEVGVRRNITTEHQVFLKDNLSAIENLVQNKIKSEDFEVVYDSAVLEANKTGSLHLYKWQTGVLERAAKIKEDPKENPYAVLVPGRGDPISASNAGIFSFEANYLKNFRGNKIGDLIGHYEQKDLDYNQLARQVTVSKTLTPAKKQKILSDIMESRRKLHTAAREILRPFLTKYATLEPKELKELRDNASFYMLEDYIRNFSKLNYETLDQAFQKLGDDFVYVHRVQTASLTRTLGFRSQTEFKHHPIVKLMTLNGMLVPQLREIMTAMQSSSEAQSLENGSIGSVIAQKIAAVAKGNKKIEAILSSVVLRVYGKRAADIQSKEEFESVFMDHYLHAVNRGMKKGISTTADPTYLAMVKSYSEFADAAKFNKNSASEGLVALFKEFKTDSKNPAEDAYNWLQAMAKKEREQQLPIEYYELGWVGGFAKEFKVPIEKAVEYSSKIKANNDKFTSQDDGVIYVLRIPVTELNPNYASGYISSFKAQFENTTSRGYGVMASKWGVFARPIISREYKYERKFGVDLADISANARDVLEMSMKHIESKADYTPYLVYSPQMQKPTAIVANLVSPNLKLQAQAIKDLSGLKFDMQTIRSESDVSGFKQLVEDVFNGTVKAIEVTSNVETRKQILNSLTLFLKEHSLRDEKVAAWVIELWEGVIPVKGKEGPTVGKDIIRKARSEMNVLKQTINVPVTEEPAS